MTRLSSYSDRGPREQLEDALQAVEITSLCPGLSTRILLLLFDGAGGMNGGQVASGLAVDVVVEQLASALTPLAPATADTRRSSGDIEDHIASAVDAANTAIVQRAIREPALAGMATTAVCAVVDGERLFVGWAGDSRCYVHDGSSLVQVTHDHSKVAELLRAGTIDPIDAIGHPDEHVITRYLGNPAGCNAETTAHRLHSGDIVLLCSDGLTDVLSDQQVSRLIEDCRRGALPFNQLAQQLVQHALRAHTFDNVTVLCFWHKPPVTRSGRTRTDSYFVSAAQAVYQLKEKSSV